MKRKKNFNGIKFTYKILYYKNFMLIKKVIFIVFLKIIYLVDIKLKFSNDNNINSYNMKVFTNKKKTK